MLGLAPDGEHAVLLDPHRHRLHVLELATRRWHETLPDFLRFSVLSCSESEAKLVEASSRRASRLLYPPDLVLSACGRFYMERIDGSQSTYLSDGWVVRSFDGEPVCEPYADVREGPLSWLSETGTARVFDDASEAEECCRPPVEATARAVVLAASGELLTLIDSILIRGRETVCGFAFPIDAGAFDPEGARLLLASKKTLTLLDVRGAPRITAQWDLRPLFDQMASSRARGPLLALVAALCRYGTLSNVARQAPSDLLSLRAMDESWQMQPIAADEAHRIHRMARRARQVDTLTLVDSNT